MIQLADGSLLVLRDILNRREPSLLAAIDDPGRSEYSIDFYNELRNLVGDEFVAKGLKEDDEPNEYGFVLEDLIDEIGRLFM